MNYTVAYEIHDAPDIRFNGQNHESFLRIIAAWLRTILMSHGPKKSTKYQHKSFVEANLLDDLMGPEISRVLR